MHRAHDTCVWSQQMTHEALVPYLVEEAAEVVDAVETGSRAHLREELGDLLWQVLFHAQIASTHPDDPFDLDDVARVLSDKMVRRHPHVFAGETAETPERVLELWNAAKAEEKRERRSVLDGVPSGMPSLALAQKVLAKGEAVGVGEEFIEAIAAAEAIAQAEGFDATPQSEEELGDTILGLVAVARAKGWDAERALRTRIRSLSEEIHASEVEE
ncbi:MazG family protein [Microbacterium sp. G2-8]|uniref:MazG family protein n=1 Tax=Microbacterium sp. G2-8 TaxID=2842454 RepID=UPI001C891C9D|nr:MazG family protein [Microbacterium sp. G2-8]